MKEEISAMMDGEIDRQEMQQCLRELRNNPEQQCCWEQFHLIGDAIRHNLPSTLKRDFVKDVKQAIASEELPVSISPQIKPQSAANTKQHIARPWAGFALAASVAAVAYLGVGMISVDEQAGLPRVASTSPLIQQPVSPNGFATVKGEQWNAENPAASTNLNSYLNSHRNYMGGQPVNSGVIPNARLVVVYPEIGE